MKKRMLTEMERNWNVFEPRVREILQRYREGKIVGMGALRLIDEALAVATLRGNCLPVEALDWEPDRNYLADEAKGYWES